MKRTIKFRGKRIDTGEWVYGWLVDDIIITELNDSHWTGITEELLVQAHRVDPDTVGQFTGLKDSEGEEAYEGDVCCLVGYNGYFCEIIYSEGSFCTNYSHPEDPETLVLGDDILASSIKVIGNKHDKIKQKAKELYDIDL